MAAPRTGPGIELAEPTKRLHSPRCVLPAGPCPELVEGNSPGLRTPLHLGIRRPGAAAVRGVPASPPSALLAGFGSDEMFLSSSEHQVMVVRLTIGSLTRPPYSTGVEPHPLNHTQDAEILSAAKDILLCKTIWDCGEILEHLYTGVNDPDLVISFCPTSLAP